LYDPVIITCEHAGNRVPSRYAALFVETEGLLATHRAYDCGALELARLLAHELEAELIFSKVTRLVVDVNRSSPHRSLFSHFTGGLDADSQRLLLDRYYHPYRRRVESTVRRAIGSGRRVVHVSVHSFTPVFRGAVRWADVGLLYDPARPREREICTAWQRFLRQLRPDLVVRRNYPYRGTSDGLTTYLRRRFGPSQYVGIELEVNQRWPLNGGPAWRKLQHDLIESFAQTAPQRCKKKR
jgi:predicted N-formylglutamate amidohydrolase